MSISFMIQFLTCRCTRSQDDCRIWWGEQNFLLALAWSKVANSSRLTWASVSQIRGCAGVPKLERGDFFLKLLVKLIHCSIPWRNSSFEIILSLDVSNSRIHCATSSSPGSCPLWRSIPNPTIKFFSSCSVSIPSLSGSKWSKSLHVNSPVLRLVR